jgi:glutathionylspermidine synthase
MQRIQVQPRANLQQRAADVGFDFRLPDGTVYWDERAYYRFSLDQVERQLEEPTVELAALCLELVARVVTDEKLLRRLQVPEPAWDLIQRSWTRGDQSLYGRFDLAYDGIKPAQLLEYNADTPTSLFEAAVFQWMWLEDMIAQHQLPAGTDQFNSLHEALIARFTHIHGDGVLTRPLHLACMMSSREDRDLIAYLVDCAGQAGFTCTVLSMEDIGTRDNGPFLDLANTPIKLLFKLYPWEWLLAEPFAQASAMATTRFLEPPWKSILSNKGILPLLWEMAPGHPNLLPAYFEDDPQHQQLGNRFARKPLYSREGSNIVLVDGDAALDRAGGPYGYGAFVRQALADVPMFDGNYPVIGSWLIGDKACGIGIREDTSRITRNTSRFVPHIIHN